MKLEGIAFRAAFIGKRIVDRFLSGSPEAQRDYVSSTLPLSKQSSEDLLLSGYRQCMGDAWDDKLNLYAFRRLLAELGFERPPSLENILTRGASLNCSLTKIHNQEVVSASDEFAKSESDAEDVLAGVVISLREGVKQAQDRAILESAGKVIREHARTLRRKRSQLLLSDDYGIVDDNKWREEIAYFLDRLVLPRIGVDAVGENLLSDIVALVDQIAAEAMLGNDVSIGDATAQLTPTEFQAYCAQVLEGHGWKTRLTKSSGDQGIDIIAERGGIVMVVQCKKYSNPVGNSAVQEAHAGKGFLGADIAVVVSNTSFTPSARELASILGVLLLHHSELVDFNRTLLSALRKRDP